MDNLTPEALKALSEAATPGEWHALKDWEDEGGWFLGASGAARADMKGPSADRMGNALYIVALVNAHRAGLLVHVDAKRGVVDWLKDGGPDAIVEDDEPQIGRDYA